MNMPFLCKIPLFPLLWLCSFLHRVVWEIESGKCPAICFLAAFVLLASSSGTQHRDEWRDRGRRTDLGLRPASLFTGSVTVG